MRRFFISLPVAALLALGIVGTTFATHCGVNGKPDGAGQHVVLLVDPATGALTILEGANAAGGFTGSFADVYIDFDKSGDISAGDGKINDTFLISMHSGSAAPGQLDEADGLAVIPPVLRIQLGLGGDPGGPIHGVGFADFSFVGGA